MESGSAWHVLVWVAPAAPRAAAYFVHAGPYATREAAVVAALAARGVQGEDRFVRVIVSAQAPTSDVWDEAEEIAPESGVPSLSDATVASHSR
jgi:hypothetical protein